MVIRGQPHITPGKGNLIQSIDKAFTVLELIGRRKELGIAEMVKDLRWKKSTVQR